MVAVGLRVVAGPRRTGLSDRRFVVFVLRVPNERLVFCGSPASGLHISDGVLDLPAVLTGDRREGLKRVFGR